MTELDLGPKTTQIIRSYSAISFLVGAIIGTLTGSMLTLLSFGIWTLYKSL
jgi:uncharacterized membrane protein YoaK (UPF0700 family)